MAVRKCPAKACEVPLYGGMLMCLRHWNQLPEQLRCDLLEARPTKKGVYKRPLTDYTKLVHDSVAQIAKLEGRDLDDE